jgi:predicted CXXCH cytochrome family protein
VVLRALRWNIFWVLLLALLTGCAGKSRYQVLTFFFDGVPPPEETRGEVGKGSQKKGAPVAAAARYVEHGPYAAKQCEACHVKASNRLVLPITELCFQCHTIDIRKKYIHGPIASGGCKVCHDPHGSRYPFLLVSEPKESCLQCHDANAIAKKEVHRRTEAQCTACHDAHSSDREYLLIGAGAGS